MSKQYIITDPGYILPKNVWSECIEKAGADDKDWGERFDEQVQAALSAFVGSKAWAESTGFGDWSNVVFGPNVLHERFCADAGMFSICEYNDAVKEATKGLPEHCFAIFETDGDISVEFDNSESDWHVAKIKSSTGESWETDLPCNNEDDDEDEDSDGED